MIVVRMHGGFGRQMFQYAYGRALIARGQDLRFDLSSYGSDRSNSYQLNAWRARVRVLRGEDAWLRPAVLGGRGWKNLRRGRFPLRVVSEQSLANPTDRLDPPPRAYLDGCWEGERFFAPAADELRDDFRPNRPLSDGARRTIDAVRSVQSVAVYLPGNEIGVEPTSTGDGVGYYRRCVATLLAEYAGVKAYVFSNGRRGVRGDLRLGCPTEFVDLAQDAEEWQRIWMIRHCRHQVIPSTALGWWAGWLKQDPTGVTFAPSRWVVQGESLPFGWRADPMTHNEGARPGRLAA